MSIFIIYKSTCLVNDKIYVGQHFTSADDGYLGSGIKFKNALKKYGKKNFIRETIEFCIPTNVPERETFWIKKLDATNPKIGYNLSLGGLGPRLFGENNPNYGNKWTEEQKEKLSHKMKGRYNGEDNPNYGNKMSDKSRQKISESHKGNTSWCKGLTVKIDERIKSLTIKKVNTIMKNGGYLKGKNHPGYDNSNDEKIIKMFNSGISIAKISKKLNMGRQTVSRHLKFNREN